MQIRPYRDSDFDDLVALWGHCDLLRPWNDPASDIRRCLESPGSALFVADTSEGLAGSVMCGSDGHRGWLYYLAVSPSLRLGGIGRRLMACGEEWLQGRGVPKVQLMIRAGNESAQQFYEKLGYQAEDRFVVSRWLAKR